MTSETGFGVESSPKGSSMPHGSSGWLMHQDPSRALARTFFITEAAASVPNSTPLIASAATPARLYVTGRMIRLSTSVSTCGYESALRESLTLAGEFLPLGGLASVVY